MSKIFVGNLSWNAAEDSVKELFEECGPIKSVNVVVDRNTGRPKGYAFVEFDSQDAANKAIEKFDNFDFLGRPLRVSAARREEDRPAGGGFRSSRPYNNRGNSGFGGGRGSDRGGMSHRGARHSSHQQYDDQ